MILIYRVCLEISKFLYCYTNNSKIPNVINTNTKEIGIFCPNFSATLHGPVYRNACVAAHRSYITTVGLVSAATPLHESRGTGMNFI